MDTQQQKQKAPGQSAAPARGAATPTKDAAPVNPTVKVRVKAGATILTSEDGRPVRKTGGAWVDLDARDMKIPSIRRNVETPEEIEAAAKPAQQQAEDQAARRALFDRFVASDVAAAAREKAARAPLLEALTPQGAAPEPARIG